ncbi:COX assembly mitochondrial protein 2 [[Candida] railenensis]|uniref:COX assembly mitochondrial protein n=1 Tax=[Candida] railenensis TaxID=45579 RepID=A0A9P0QVR8_9ASCO|nr:COX assembly mitochondrial protein 2 [[Candida] railenensis]
MHPQLDRRRFESCEKLMDALEECHRKEFIMKAMGLCNFEKDEVAKCLHYVRTEDAKDRIRDSREKMKQQELRRKQKEEELYGKNGYLKKMIEREAEKKSK